MDTASPAPLALHTSSSPASSGSKQHQHQGLVAPSMSARPTTSSSSTATPAAQMDEPDISSPHELTAFVDDVLSRLEATFDNMSSQVLDRLDTISKRIDTIELSISDLMHGNTFEDATALQRVPEDTKDNNA